MDSHTIPPEYGNSYGAVPHRAVPDLEEGNIFGVIDPFERTFQDRSYRMFFVRRVLALVGFQLFACTGAMALSLFYEPVNTFFKSNAGMSLGIVSFFLWIGLFIAIGCCRVGRGPPNPFNVTLLLVSTLLLSTYTANVVVKFEIPDIMIAAATTVGVFDESNLVLVL
ncbi:unnamed protein product [Orchesella dallaii]|uniref:Uncharacterized protein n=1 Tax=Orchesella dallaii TaxID=48710 RepID=A0ABP1QNM0_9HEXA